jgi:hypothetical protein
VSGPFKREAPPSADKALAGGRWATDLGEIHPAHALPKTLLPPRASELEPVLSQRPDILSVVARCMSVRFEAPPLPLSGQAPTGQKAEKRTGMRSDRLDRESPLPHGRDKMRRKSLG